MAAIGGSVESISINGQEFPVAGDAEINRKLGGFENEVQANGDGSARIIKNRITGMLSGCVVSIDDDRGDHEFLQDVANSKNFVVVAITFAGGAVYQGLMQISGELQVSSQSSTATFDLSGGALTKQ